jgi:hypothetical protein
MEGRARVDIYHPFPAEHLTGAGEVKEHSGLLPLVGRPRKERANLSVQRLRHRRASEARPHRPSRLWILILWRGLFLLRLL